MKDAGTVEPKARRGGSAEEAAFLDLLRTTDMLSRRLTPVLKAAELSSTQYNALRILRGAPEGLTCGEVANRMITKDPDITRLLDRLEKRGLTTRCRETKDRRMVLTRIAPEGSRCWPASMGRCRKRIVTCWDTWAGSGCERWPNC